MNVYYILLFEHKISEKNNIFLRTINAQET